MLEMVDKNCKATVIIMFSEIKENMLTTNETMRNLSIDIETIKNSQKRIQDGSRLGGCYTHLLPGPN